MTHQHPIRVPDEGNAPKGPHASEQAQGSSLLNWVDRRSVAAKLRLAISASVSVPLILAGALLICVLYLGQEGTTKAKTATAQLHLSHAALSMVRASRSVTSLKSSPSDEGFENFRARFDEAHGLIQLSNSPSANEILPGIKPQLAAFADRAQVLKRGVYAADTQTSPDDLDTLCAALIELEQDIETYSRNLHDETKISGEMLIKKVAASATIGMLGALGGAIVTIWLARAIIQNATASIDDIVTATKRLAEGEVEVYIPGAHRGDELGAIARALEVFRHSSISMSELKEAQARDAQAQLDQQIQLQEAADRSRLEKSDLLDLLASEFEISVGNVIAAVAETSGKLDSTSQILADHADASAKDADFVSTSLATAIQRLTASAAATDQFAISINEISEQANSSAELAQGANQLAASASAKMRELSEAAQEIGGIAEAIGAVASRTNLLAINASIEASRGGEAGRGFAVVANEVKALAGQTSDATSSVAKKIAAIQLSTKESVECLDSIVTQVARLEESSGVIAEAVRQQSQSADELAGNLEVVVNGSDKVRMQIDDLRTSSERNETAAKEVLKQSHELGEHAASLRTKAESFVANVRMSSQEMAEVTKPLAGARA